MSDIPQTSTPVQIEGTRVNSAISEALLQLVGGNVNFLLASILPVGSIIHSMLTQAQFQAASSTAWVIADGSSCAGSNYESVTGNSTVPDCRGIFLRGKNGARSGSTGDSAGDRALGAYQADQFQTHTHDLVNVTRVAAFGGPIEADDGSEIGIENTTVTAGPTSGVNTGSETRSRNIALNIFIRIN